MKTIYPFFKWVDNTWLNEVINNSNWLFPAIEAVHIVALALLFGAAIMLNLRILGLVLRHRPVGKLARELDPWTASSLVTILLSGALLFVAEAVKSYHSGPFRIKMVLLVAAIVFHYAVISKIAHKEGNISLSVLAKTSAVVALVLWFGVGFAGRAIGFF